MRTKVKCKCRKLSDTFIVHGDAEFSTPNLDDGECEFKVQAVYKQTCPFYQEHLCPAVKDCALAEGESFNHFDYVDPKCLG